MEWEDRCTSMYEVVWLLVPLRAGAVTSIRWGMIAFGFIFYSCLGEVRCTGRGDRRGIWTLRSERDMRGVRGLRGRSRPGVAGRGGVRGKGREGLVSRVGAK